MSAPLLQPARVERDNWSPRGCASLRCFDFCDSLWDRNWLHLAGRAFGQLFRDTLRAFATVHFVPHLLRANTRGDPQNGQIVEQIRAFADHRVSVAVDG